MPHITLATPQHISPLKAILNTIELFPSEMLEEMMYDYLNNPDSQEVWVTALEDNEPIAIGYCAPEKFTDGTYNLYALGVKADCQSGGVGSKMMRFIEDYLKQNGGRLLIIDTSGTVDFRNVRKFYEKLNYKKEAVIRDFWEDGDDKVIYWKRL